MEGRADTTALGAYFWLTFSRFVPQRHDVATSIASPDDGSFVNRGWNPRRKRSKTCIRDQAKRLDLDTHTTEGSSTDASSQMQQPTKQIPSMTLLDDRWTTDLPQTTTLFEEVNLCGVKVSLSIYFLS